MTRLIDLLRATRMCIPIHLVDEVVIFGSAAIVLRGVDLGRAPGDVDLFISPSTFAAWPAAGFVRDTKDGVPRIIVDGVDAEVFAPFADDAFARVRERAATLADSHGMRVASLDDLLAWKRRMTAAGRTKDSSDVQRIEAHIADGRATEDEVNAVS